MSSKNEIKKIDSNLNEYEKKLEKNCDQKEYSEEDDINFETRIERNYENKIMMKKDKNAITGAVIQSIIMKKDQMMTVKITIKEDT